MPEAATTVDDPRWLIPDLVEALVRLGQHDHAAALMATEHDSPPALGWLNGRLAAAAAMISGTDDAFAEAAGMAERLTPRTRTIGPASSSPTVSICAGRLASQHREPRCDPRSSCSTRSARPYGQNVLVGSWVRPMSTPPLQIPRIATG